MIRDRGECGWAKSIFPDGWERIGRHSHMVERDRSEGSSIPRSSEPRTTEWPHTRTQWRRLKMEFAGLLHAIAENIESRVYFAETVERWTRAQKEDPQ